MPTPSTTSIPEIGSDAAPLVPDITVTFLTNVTAADTDAAGLPTSRIQRVLRLLRQGWRALQEERQRHRLRIALLGMNERELKDIGITSADVGYIAAHRAIDRLRDGTTYPWMR